MPDIIQVAEDLKNAPDQWLAQQMQNPSGTAPPWLIASEVARREKLRSGAAKAQAPQSSVSQDLLKSLYAKIPPTAGLAAPPPGKPGGPAPPGMPPVSLTPGQSTMGTPAPGAAPPSNFRMPPRAMAAGGEYDEDGDQAGDEPYDDSAPDVYNLPMRPPTRREQMNQLMVPPVPEQPAPAMMPPQVQPVQQVQPQPTPSRPGPGTGAARPAIDPRIAEMVKREAAEFRLPEGLIYSVIKNESGGDPNAVSNKGARGLMQITPIAVKDVGGDPGKIDFNGPATNIHYGAAYLRKMVDTYDGDYEKAVKAYNAGPGAMKKYDDNPPYRETQRYSANVLADTVNAMRRNANLPPLNASGVTALRQQAITAPYNAPQNFEDWRNNPPAAGATDTAAAAPPAANVAPPATDGTAVAPTAAPAPVVSTKQPPLQQVYNRPTVSPEAADIDKQITSLQQGHVSLSDRQKELLGQDNIDLLTRAGKGIFGEPQDYSQYQQAVRNVMQIAQQQMHPSIGQSLMQFGLALMANPSHNFGMAVGQAGSYAMNSMLKLKQEGMKDYLEAAKAGVNLQEKMDLYNARIGQYKMQRLGAQQNAATADERAFQTDITKLEQQRNTAQRAFETKFTTPAAVANMAWGIANREHIQLDPNKDPLDQFASLGRTDLIAEANGAGKPGGGARLNSVQQTQELRARSLNAMYRDEWDPNNPNDAQFTSDMDKLKTKHADMVGMATTAAGANFPEQMREARELAAGIMAGRVDPSMTGMYGKQVLVKAVLENDYQFDLAKMQQEWNAVKAFTASMNNAQQIKYRTDINFVANQIPLVQNAYEAWKKAITAEAPAELTRFKGFNNAALQASVSLGGQTGAIARTLIGHIAELQSALPGVYSGGYSPHDEDLQRVKLMIDSSWDDPSFAAGMKVIGDTVLARKNAVNSVMPYGVSAGSQYTKNLPGANAPPETREYQGHTYEKRGNQWVLVR